MADISSVNRRLLEISICALLREQGFASASKLALETLTEMLQSCKQSFLFLRFRLLFIAVLSEWNKQKRYLQWNDVSISRDCTCVFCSYRRCDRFEFYIIGCASNRHIIHVTVTLYDHWFSLRLQIPGLFFLPLVFSLSSNKYKYCALLVNQI